MTLVQDMSQHAHMKRARKTRSPSWTNMRSLPRICLSVMCCCVLAILSIGFERPAMSNDPIFDDLEWRARVIVITGPSDDPLYLDQVSEFRANLDGLADRDITVIHFHNRVVESIDDISAVYFEKDVLSDSNDQRYLQSRLKIDDDVFSLALIGKDGGLKEYWNAPAKAIPASQIFSIIDAMPMRVREMENR